MNREEIAAFFADCIVDGVSREIVFPDLQEEGRIEIELVAPPQAELAPVRLSFPADEKEA